MSGHWKSSQGRGEGGARGKEQREGRREGRRPAGEQALRAPVTQALPAREAGGSQGGAAATLDTQAGARPPGLGVWHQVPGALGPRLGSGPRSVPHGRVKVAGETEEEKFGAGRGRGKAGRPHRRAAPRGGMGGPGGCPDALPPGLFTFLECLLNPGLRPAPGLLRRLRGSLP